MAERVGFDIGDRPEFMTLLDQVFMLAGQAEFEASLTQVITTIANQLLEEGVAAHHISEQISFYAEETGFEQDIWLLAIETVFALSEKRTRKIELRKISATELSRQVSEAILPNVQKVVRLLRSYDDADEQEIAQILADAWSEVKVKLAIR